MPKGHTETIQLTFIPQVLAWYIQYQHISSSDIYSPNCWHHISNTNIYISKNVLSPTLCPKGTQKLSNFVYIWHIHMTEGTNLWKRWRIVCLSVITPTFPLKTLLNHFQCFTDPHNLTYYESSRHVLSTDIGDLCWVTKLYFFGISSFLSNTSSSTLSSVSTTSSFLSSPSPPPLGLKYRDSPIEQKAICWLNVEMGWTVRVASQVPVHLNNQDPSQ